MAGQAIRLRFSGETVVGDDAGEFEVPDKDGAFLCALPSGAWKALSKAPRALPEPPKPAAPKPAPPPPAPAVAPPAPAPAASEDDTAKVKVEQPPDEEEGPDLTGMSKTRMAAVAAEYDIEVPTAIRRGLVDDMRRWLNVQLYGEE
jgi:hypothetical protein